MKKLPVSLILPTFNEKENLEIIIPEIVDLFENIIETNYEILVVDDSSNDGTDKLVNELSNNNKNIVFISRQNSPSLPLSILKGITEAKYENVEVVIPEENLGWGKETESKETKIVNNIIIIGN